MTRLRATVTTLMLAAGVPSLATQALAQQAPAPAVTKMTDDMAAVPRTGNPDRDFVALMEPHHQGAIEMARDELAHGKDPQLLRLARGIIAAQQKEITTMKAWQAKHPAP